MSRSYPRADGVAGVRRSAFDLTVELAGDLDLGVAVALQQQLEELARDAPMQLTLDLAAVEFIDSAGLASLAVVVIRRREQGLPTWVTNPNRNVRRLAALCRLEELLVRPAVACRAEAVFGGR